MQKRASVIEEGTKGRRIRVVSVVGTRPEAIKMAPVTAHRRENWGNPLRNICTALTELVRKYDDISIVYPLLSTLMSVRRLSDAFEPFLGFT